MTKQEKINLEVLVKQPDVKPLYAVETREEEIKALQELIDSGMAWRLEGAVGRAAMRAIETGECIFGEEGHRDYYGNYVPSRHEVKPGTKGSVEYQKTMRERD